MQQRSLDRLRNVWMAVTRNPCASVRELAAQTDTSYSRAADCVRTLAKLGYIEQAPGRCRARRIVVPFVEVRR